MSELIRAVERNDIGAVKDLLTRLTIDDIDKQKTALMLAAQKDDADIVQAILASDKCTDAVIDAHDDHGNTAFMLAAVYGHDHVVRTFLESPKMKPQGKQRRSGEQQQMGGVAPVAHQGSRDPLNARNNTGLSALMLAAINDHTDVVKQLLESKYINVHERDTRGNTALMLAAARGFDDVVADLLKSEKCDAIVISTKNDTEDTALTLAVKAGFGHVVNALLDSSKFNDFQINRPNGKDEYKTALMLAVDANNINIVQKLLASPYTDATLYNANGDTALMLAAEKGYDDIVNALLESDKEVDINHRNVQSKTALMLAAEKGYVNIVQKLLQSPGINVGMTDLHGNTALMLAAKNGRTEVVQAFLNSDIGNTAQNINNVITCQNGEPYTRRNTPLTVATRYAQVEVVRKLLTSPVIDINIMGYIWVNCSHVGC